MNLDFNKFYAIGTTLAGSNGKDLVHICYERLLIKGIEPDDLDGYFYKMMRNQVKEKSSQFNKLFNKRNKKDFDTLECEYFEADTEHLKEIIKELKNQGHYLFQVKAFEELAQTRNYSEFTRKTGIRYETLMRIVTFVRSKILDQNTKDIVFSNKTEERLKKYFEE